MIMNNKILVITGPTASGKSNLAIDFAKKWNGEVVSADSMQIYRKMNIGTAKITDDMGVKHHLIDIVEPSQTFTLSDFLSSAKNAVDDILNRGKLPIITGGTGLYISSFIDNITLTETETDYAYRQELREYAAKYGSERLRELLKDIDPESYESLHPNDEKRIIRALEIYHSSGISISEHNRRSKLNPSPYEFFMIGINFRDRTTLYERINRRVDAMIESGLVNEVRSLDYSSLSDTAKQAIGYKQIFQYLNGEISFEDAVEKIKMESRRYAKRQLTWFRRDKRIDWIYVDELKSKLTCELFETSMENFIDV